MRKKKKRKVIPMVAKEKPAPAENPKPTEIPKPEVMLEKNLALL